MKVPPVISGFMAGFGFTFGALLSITGIILHDWNFLLIIPELYLVGLLGLYFRPKIFGDKPE